MDLERIDDKDKHFIIANIDLANLLTDKEFPLGDDERSTRTDYTNRSELSLMDRSLDPPPNALANSTVVTMESTITQNSTLVNQAAILDFYKQSTANDKQALLKLLNDAGGPED